MFIRTIAIIFATFFADPALADELLIQNVTIVSPERDGPLESADVLIRDGRIVEVGADPIFAPSAEVINGTGRYLIPGLIDSHVHLYHATGLRRGLVSDEDRRALYSAYMTQLPRSFLHWEYTTVVELNADFPTNEAFLAQPVHPHLGHCGEGLILSNGFMAAEIGESALEDYPNFLHDRFTTPELPSGYDPADHTPAATLDVIAANGGRCVKLYHEEAAWLPDGPTWPHPSIEIVREVVAEAHARNMTVFLHGTTTSAYALGLAGGVDVIAHGLWEWGGDPRSTEMPQNVQNVVERLGSAGMQIQPTARTLGQSQSMFLPDLLDDPAWRDAVPAAYLDYLRGPAQAQRYTFMQLFGEGFVLEEIPAVQQNYFDRNMGSLAELDRQGVELLFGTDTAVGSFGWGNPPGLNGYWEMQAWADAGIPLAVILDAATRRNARALHMEGEIGTVESGKRADLLLLNQNPLETVAAYDDIALIILEGLPIDRATLSAQQTD